MLAVDFECGPAIDLVHDVLFRFGHHHLAGGGSQAVVHTDPPGFRREDVQRGGGVGGRFEAGPHVCGSEGPVIPGRTANDLLKTPRRAEHRVHEALARTVQPVNEKHGA